MRKPGGEQLSNNAIARTWQLACQQAGIDYEVGKAVPPLFELDERLAIKTPWHFRPDQPDADMRRRREFDRLSEGDQSWTRGGRI